VAAKAIEGGRREQTAPPALPDAGKAMRPASRVHAKAVPTRTVVNAAPPLAGLEKELSWFKREPHVVRMTQAAESAAAANHVTALSAKTSARTVNAFVAADERVQQPSRPGTCGYVAVNRKLLDIAWANLTSGIELAQRLAAARTPLEAAQLQCAFVNDQMRAFASQVEELRALFAVYFSAVGERSIGDLGHNYNRRSQ
jgi:hypothetical protein